MELTLIRTSKSVNGEEQAVAKVTTPRERWVQEGLRALAAGGPDAVRIEVLAKRLGVTKGGFYWHFTDRASLLGAMLDAWEQEGVDDPILKVDALHADGRSALRELFAIAIGSIDRWPIELAVREWARRDASVLARVEQVDNRRMDYMRGLFSDFCRDEVEVEARCLLVFTTYVGHNFVAASHGSLSRLDVIRASMELLLT
ncbi:MAG: TetR/AcrR family transcriptional regulator [Aeromicrobium sp.]